MAEVDPGEAREQARQVLEGDRYQPADVPRPLRGVLRWVGDRVADVTEPLLDLVSTPAGLAVALLLVAGATVALVILVARRRNRTAEVAETRRRRSRSLDPATLEQEAERAEAEGDLDAALRLRFRAGVLRLEQAAVIPARADATTADLVGRVGVPVFAPLARTFDEVAYGGRPATPDDVATARRDWPAVVAAATAAASTASTASTASREPVA